MTAVFAIFVATVCLVSLLIEDTEAVCCYKKNRYCLDCSQSWGYCGKGSCNIFGCACEGGCKESCNPTISLIRNGCTCNDRKRDLKDPDSEMGLLSNGHEFVLKAS